MVSRTLILDHLNVVVNVHTGAGRNELTDNNIFFKTHELIGLSIVPRYAGITHTGKHILLYEDITLLGIVCGNLFFLYGWHIPGGTFTLLLYGLFSGIFLGGWIMALAEMADVFPIFSRRIKLTNGIRWVVIAVAFGKALGSLYYFYKRWFP